jgi:hypothetical protein
VNTELRSDKSKEDLSTVWKVVLAWIFKKTGGSVGLFISPSGISELDCATTKTDKAERNIPILR